MRPDRMATLAQSLDEAGLSQLGFQHTILARYRPSLP